jgi:hypothetical protein
MEMALVSESKDQLVSQIVMWMNGNKQEKQQQRTTQER